VSGEGLRSVGFDASASMVLRAAIIFGWTARGSCDCDIGPERPVSREISRPAQIGPDSASIGWRLAPGDPERAWSGFE
jgi:hypothetical protein